MSRLAAAFLLGMLLSYYLRQREPAPLPLTWRDAIDADYV